MRWWLLLFVPLASGQMFSAVVPDLPGSGPGDEAFAIRCDVCSLDGWTVTDDEGTVSLVGELRGEAWWAGDPALLAAFDGPDATAWDDPAFRLANDGESLRLLDAGGVERDRFTWGPGGDVRYRSPGAVYRPTDDGWITPRIHRVGETSLDAPAFAVDEALMVRAPDNLRDVLFDRVTGAEQRLHLHVYTFLDARLAAAMVAAAERGVDVAVLVDDSPVGLDADAQRQRAQILGALHDAGALVLESGGRYDSYHQKVLIADDQIVVQSENWVGSAVGSSTAGNRGWGIVMQGPIVDWFAGWMADDRDAWDAKVWTAGGALPAQFPAGRGNYRPMPAQLVHDLHVTPIISPDHSAYDGAVAGLLQSAEQRIWAEQLTLRTHETNRMRWNAPDRYWQALEAAHERGVNVHVFTEGRFADDAVLAAPFVHDFDVPALGTLHNKAWIIDDLVVLGSMNGNHASRAQNREVSLILDGAEALAVAEAWWREDHDAAANELPMSPWPILLLLALVARRRL